MVPLALPKVEHRACCEVPYRISEVESSPRVYRPQLERVDAIAAVRRDVRVHQRGARFDVLALDDAVAFAGADQIQPFWYV